MVTMCRSINTVGQGAFYTETFCGKSKTNIVYDCGSLHNVNLIQLTIENVFEKGEKIAAVFISHFDEDHINGLEHLLTYCSVDNLFLPLIQDETKALLLLSFLAQGIFEDSFLYSFIENPASVVDRQHTRIVYVNEFGGEDFSNEGQQEPFTIDDDKRVNTREEIPSGTPCKLLNLEWVYVPFNYREKARYNQLIRLLKRYGIPIPKSVSEVSEIYLHYSDKLKKIYFSITGSINVNSMVMYSGPFYPSRESYFRGIRYLYCGEEFYHGGGEFCCMVCDDQKKTYYNCKYDPCRVGCLYTGDFNASSKGRWEKLEKCYAKYWEQIGTWQIPHHGAQSSFNSKITNGYTHTAIISAGSSNQFGHPHEAVVRTLLLHDINVFIVTEIRNSQARFIIQF